MESSPDASNLKEQDIVAPKKMLRPLLFVAAMAAVGFGLVYASTAPSKADVNASRIWVNTVTAETTPSNCPEIAGSIPRRDFEDCSGSK